MESSIDLASYKHIEAKRIIKIFSQISAPIVMRLELEPYFYNIDKEKIDQRWRDTREEYIRIAREMLMENLVYFHPTGENDDRQRVLDDNGNLLLDTIVIHHSNTKDNLIESLSHQELRFDIAARHLLRLYFDYFSNQKWDTNKGKFVYSEYGNPLYTGHYVTYNDQVIQTPITYHYIIFKDGTILNTLPDDKYLGWHARGANQTSVGICFVGDFSEKRPTKAAIRTAKELIGDYKQKYKIPINRIIGHGEVHLINSKITPNATECPGKSFHGPNGWKSELLTSSH